eukprot:Seg1795.4 transcript_id=Seg1795.4/GoldUCD/mRNA.D3Y31 product="Tetratricopeptide repeat protein 28" protein_id=Seg1795.4/GoldUCD/D3Y31
MLSQYDESAKYLSKYIEQHTELDRREELLLVSRLLGTIKLRKSDYDGAIHQFQKCLSMANDIDDKRGIMTENYEIGLLLQRERMYTQSVEWLERSLSLAQEQNDQDFQVKISTSLSLTYHNTGEHERSISLVNPMKDNSDSDETFKKKAMDDWDFLVAKLNGELFSDLFDEAYDTARKLLSKSDDVKRVKCLLLLGRISFARELYNVAKDHLDKVLLICEGNACYTDDKMKALQLYATTFFKLSQYNMAREKASKLLETASDACHKVMIFEGHLLLGAISWEEGNFVEAKRCFQEMEKLISDIKELKYDILLWTLSARIKAKTTGQLHFDAFKILERLLQDVGGEVDLTLWCNRFLILIDETKDDPNFGMDCFKTGTVVLKASLANHEKISKSFGKHDHHRVSALKRFIDGYKVLAKWLIVMDMTDEAILYADRGRMRVLQEILQQKYCMAVKDESESEKLDLEGIRDIAAKEQCCIVFYLMLEDCLVIWIISEKGFECQRVTKFVCEESELIFEGQTNPAYYLEQVVYNLDDVVGQASVFRGAASKDSEDVDSTEYGDEDLMIPKSTHSEYRGDKINDKIMSCNQFELLYDWLIAPIVDKLTEDKILIIPDNFMFQIPFIALKDKKTGKHLADMKSVRLAPSLMTLQILNDPSVSNKHSKGGALVVAADDVGKVKYDGKEKKFPKLKYAAQEAEMIGKLLKVDPLIGKEATKRVVVEQLSEDHKVLHIAAHGAFPGQIILTPNDTSTGCLPLKDDYMLHMSDVMKMGVRAQLVVLSCCKSGDGPQTPEGIIGFGRAFLAAGARAVLVALWDVKDRATFLLMEKFYQCFVNGKSASDSLSEAVKALKSMKGYEDERIWGPYVLLGDEVYWKERDPGLFNCPFSSELSLNLTNVLRIKCGKKYAFIKKK